MTYTEAVKVGTLVPGSQNTHKYIEQILGHQRVIGRAALVMPTVGQELPG